MKTIPDPEKIDESNPEWTKETFKRAKGFEHLPESLQKKLMEQSPSKISVTLELSSEVLQTFRSSGGNWQLRIEEALREWIKEHET